MYQYVIIPFIFRLKWCEGWNLIWKTWKLLLITKWKNNRLYNTKLSFGSNDIWYPEQHQKTLWLSCFNFTFAWTIDFARCIKTQNSMWHYFICHGLLIFLELKLFRTKKMQLSRCSSCVSLKCSTLIIGTLNLVTSIPIISPNGFSLNDVFKEKPEYQEADHTG